MGNRVKNVNFGGKITNDSHAIAFLKFFQLQALGSFQSCNFSVGRRVYAPLLERNLMIISYSMLKNVGIIFRLNFQLNLQQ